MHTCLRFSGLAKHFGSKTLFSGLEGEINSGQIIGLIGDNGSGKSTLLQIFLGREDYSEGQLEFPGGSVGIAYMPQQVKSDAGSVLDFVASGHYRLWQLKGRLEGLEAEMSAPKQHENSPVLDEYGKVLQDYQALDGYSLYARAERALVDVSLPEELWQLPLTSLSGGQKTRASLARCLVDSPDLLLLDEPTNYLDFAGLRWLEKWLTQSGRTVVLVSHDRYFLDRVATHIWDLRFGRLQCYSGNYSAYREQRTQAETSQQETYQRQQAEQKRLRELAERQMQWYHAAHKDAGQDDYLRGRAKKMAKRAKAVVSRVEKQMEDMVAKPDKEQGVFIRFHAPEGQGDLLMGAKDLCFSYENHPVLQRVDFTLHGGERVALIGENGAGKTTLIKLLLGELRPTSGTLNTSLVARVGYFSQERADINLANTALQELLTVGGLDKERAWYVLGRLGFRGNEALKLLRNCSLGERAKVSLAKLLVKEYHVLVLDEPTNHLDIRSRETIEEALQEFSGALVLVSHDRYFLDASVNQVYHLQGGHLTRYLGHFSYFEQKRTENREAVEREEQILVKRARLAWLIAQLTTLEPGSASYQVAEAEIRVLGQELRHML